MEHTHGQDAGFGAAEHSPDGPTLELEIRRDERQRLSQELHDSTAQLLVVLELQLGRLKRLAHQQRLQPVLAELQETVRIMHEELRGITRENFFRPTLLSAAIESMAGNFAARSGLKVDTDFKGSPVVLPPATAKALYRVAQESLANIARHSSAHNVCIRLATMARAVTLSIADDGQGFHSDTGLNSTACGRGLVNMRDRVTGVGGRLHIGNLPGGAVVSARVPLRESAVI
jgi:two-component system NarL family sensor kinase